MRAVLVLVALVVAVASCVVNPGLIPWIAAGVALAFLPDLVRRLGIRRKRVGQGMLALLGVAAVTFLFANANEGLNFRVAGPVVSVEVRYAGDARLRDDPHRLVVTDTLTVTPEATRAAAEEAEREPDVYRRKVPPPGGDFERALRGDIEHALTAGGWTAGPPDTAGRRFTRVRTSPIEFHRVKAQRAVTVALPSPYLQTDPPSEYAIRLRRSEKSEFTVTAEKNAIGDEVPEGTTHDDPHDDDVEVTAVAVPDDEDEVTLDVRRPLFREDPFVRAADVTFADLIGLAYTAVFGLIGGFVKDELKKRAKRGLDRVLRRRPEPGAA